MSVAGGSPGAPYLAAELAAVGDGNALGVDATEPYITSGRPRRAGRRHRLARARLITPAGPAAASALLREELAAGRPAGGFPHALVTMWSWVTEGSRRGRPGITRHLAPLLKRDPATLCGRVCVGPAGMCAELLSGFAEAGCGRVHFWPLGAEGRQVDLIASTVPGLRP